MNIYRVISITVILISLSSHASADPLCGITAARLSPEGLQVEFDSKRSLRLDVHDEGSKTEYTLSNAGLVAAGKKYSSLSLPLGAVAYGHYNENFSCMFRYEEREGKKGLSVEEYRHAPKEPPRINTLFVEAF